MSSSQTVALCLLMLLTGAVGTITGGNSLVNVPVMMTIGMSSREAVATNMFAVLFMTVSSTARFARSGLISGSIVAPLCAITAVTSAAGAAFAVKLPESVVKTVVAVSMGTLVLIMVARRNEVKREVTVAPGAPVWGYLLAAVLGVYGGFFSGGYTTLMTMVGVSCFGRSMLDSVALMKAVNLASCAAATVVFAWAHLIDLRGAWPLALANLVGGWMGAHFAARVRPPIVRGFFVATVALLALKLMVYDVAYRLLLANEVG